jgi:hypothetical protein
MRLAGFQQLPISRPWIEVVLQPHTPLRPTTQEAQDEKLS